MICKERNPQPDGQNGSLKWLQRLVENNPALLAGCVRAASGRMPDWTIDWVSPRQHDDWAEYRDGRAIGTVRTTSTRIGSPI